MNKDDNLREYSEIFTGVLCDRTVSLEVGTELTLPEHQPEARRILWVRERVLPAAKYVSASGVECNGNIDYTVLYVGADGGLYSAELSAEYETSVPMDAGADALSDGASVTVTTVSEGVTARTASPRRISIKNRLRSHVRAYADIGMGDRELDNEELQKQYRSVENATVCPLISEPIEISDEIGGLFEDSRVISVCALATVSDIRRSSEGAYASGEVVLKLLVCREGGRAEALTKKIPFEGMAEGSESMADALCSIYGRVTDITVNVDEGKAVCNITLILSGIGAKNKRSRYVSDAYSAERECQCVCENITLPVTAVCVGGNFSQSERLSASESGIAEGATVIDAYGSAILDGCEYTGGKYLLVGQCKYSILCEKDGEYSTVTVELPIKYELDGAFAESISFDAPAEVISCRVRSDGDTLGIDSEIAAYVSVFGSTDISPVSEVRFGEQYGKRKSRMVVYYPAAGETSWDAAKKYHVPADSLAAEKNYYLFG